MNEPQGTKKMLQNETAKKQFRRKMQIAAYSANAAAKKVNEHPTTTTTSHDNSFKKAERVKRQSDWLQTDLIKTSVSNNKEAIAQLDQTTINLTAEAGKRDLILNALPANLSILRTHFNKSFSPLKYLEATIDDLVSRLRIAELTTTEIVDEMAKAQSYLKSLERNASKVVDVKPTENVTEEKIEEVKKLPPSKDTEAFNDYIRNIERMTKEDILAIGHQKDDFIAICSWQGGICDSRLVNQTEQ